MKTLTTAILLSLFSCHLWAAGWIMEPDGSRLAFDASYQGEPVPGEFHRFQARLMLDPKAPENAVLNVSVDMTSIDMGSGELDEGVATEEWFDTDQYPQARFHSREIRHVDNAQYVASGTLSLKGVERAIELPFMFRMEGQTAIMSGELAMQRPWFHIGTGDWNTDELIGFNVQVRFKVTWRRDD